MTETLSKDARHGLVVDSVTATIIILHYCAIFIILCGFSYYFMYIQRLVHARNVEIYLKPITNSKLHTEGKVIFVLKFKRLYARAEKYCLGISSITVSPLFFALRYRYI